MGGGGGKNEEGGIVQTGMQRSVMLCIIMYTYTLYVYTVDPEIFRLKFLSSYVSSLSTPTKIKRAEN